MMFVGVLEAVARRARVFRRSLLSDTAALNCPESCPEARPFLGVPGSSLGMG